MHTFYNAELYNYYYFYINHATFANTISNFGIVWLKTSEQVCVRNIIININIYKNIFAKTLYHVLWLYEKEKGLLLIKIIAKLYNNYILCLLGYVWGYIYKRINSRIVSESINHIK